jgi:hypothetical protein
MLGYTAEADEVFKRNSEQQDKRREKNEPQLISKPLEELSLNNSELLRLNLKKPIVRSREWLIAFILLNKTSIKTNCFIELLIIHPEGLDTKKTIIILRSSSSADLFCLDIESAGRKFRSYSTSQVTVSLINKQAKQCQIARIINQNGV